MIKKINGIVLYKIDYQENDEIVTIFSKEFGKLSFYALGVKQAKSKNKYSLQLFSESEFELFLSQRSNKLSKLKTGNLIKSRTKVANVYDDYLTATLIVEILDQAFEERIKATKTYNLLKSCLDYLISNDDNLIVVNYYMFYMLTFYGLKWVLDACQNCGKKSKIRTISFRLEGLVCDQCWAKNDYIFSLDLLKEIIKWNKEENYDLRNLQKYKTNHEIIKLFQFLCDYYLAKVAIFSYSIYELKKHSVYFI